jgi:predicted LPLAT superfamily acyltransferase
VTPRAFEARALPVPRWEDLPERGAPGLLRLIGWIAVRIGRSAARLLLYPITLYFLITARAARRVSYQYLERVRGGPSHWWQVFRHFHCFAATILDRIYLLRGEFHHFDVRLNQKEILHRQIESGKGCILLGSHLGSFEVLRTLGVTQQDFPLKVLMDLDAGFLIGMLGDRIANDGKTTQCQFLGAPTRFPAGPVLLASIMRCPVILFFGLYRGGNRYEIYFEHFAQEMLLNHDQRVRDIQHWTQRYVERLEYYTRLAPYNWFNFYPFWD